MRLMNLLKTIGGFFLGLVLSSSLLAPTYLDCRSVAFWLRQTRRSIAKFGYRRLCRILYCLEHDARWDRRNR